MGKIIFYEDRNFEGRHYECMSDSSDLRSVFERCRSIRVESGMFMIYDRSGYMGNQCFMKKGEYSDYMGMAGGLNECVRSCRMIPMHRGSYKMRLYEHFDMGGEMMELTSDCPSLMDRFHNTNINSCNVMDGHWLMYEQPNYRGRHFYLKPGQYKSFSDWSGNNSRVGSIRRLMDL
ncbi:gamma-crystallin M3-like [Notolabrus celidotus]|uniref:gamma-crystallin M3-like n=1 Tax=Notolabrus celidotus TaxID=1203425 RepID=UPI00149047B3|nr:gamma-crystallin M3-like [Notolabrus celidotus]XP_034549012.1 gamma-crystallin M3-like [Notolabrus celidotus]XP_034549013.1 gamma-crystallin M3-like [Notolabrus celidotus]